MAEFHVNGTLLLALESTHRKMDKPVRQHIVELEHRIRHLSQEMMRNQKTRTELNRMESELRVAQQALELYKKAIQLEGNLNRTE